jgi:hypothetical protein
MTTGVVATARSYSRIINYDCVYRLAPYRRRPRFRNVGKFSSEMLIAKVWSIHDRVVVSTSPWCFAEHVTVTHLLNCYSEN